MKRNLSIVMMCVMGAMTAGYMILCDWYIALAYGSATSAWFLNVRVLNLYEADSDSIENRKFDRRTHHVAVH